MPEVGQRGQIGSEAVGVIPPVFGNGAGYTGARAAAAAGGGAGGAVFSELCVCEGGSGLNAGASIGGIQGFTVHLLLRCLDILLKAHLH